ncbi:MAG: FkbM family methyltransferase [Candidatus Pristimantibacillus sp.]
MFPIIKTNLTINGIPVTLLHYDDMVVGWQMRNSTHQWSNVLEYLKQTIKPGSRVIDAGGNIGNTSIFLAKIQPDAIIYCFEPDPQNFALLNMNIELNQVPNVLTFNYALGKTERHIPFYMNKVNFGDHRSASPYKQDTDAHLFSTLPDPVMNVNPVSFLKKSLGKHAPQSIDILRTDTQGADFEIIEACLPLLKKDSTILAQFSPYHLHRHGTTIKDIESIVKKFSDVALFSATQHSIKTNVYSFQQLSTRFETLHKNFIGFYHIALSNNH